MRAEGYQHLKEGREGGKEIPALHSSKPHVLGISFLDLLRCIELKASQSIYI